MYLLSPVARNSWWFSVMNISTAQVSAYAEMFGSEYGSPNPSLPVVPTPPVMYIFRSTASTHMRCGGVEVLVRGRSARRRRRATP